MSEIRNLTRNGEIFYPQTHVEGVLDPEGNYIGNYEENPEYVRVELDNEGKILRGIKNNGIEVLGTGYEIGGNITTIFDNPEFIDVKVDANGRFLEGFNNNGEKIYGVIPPQIKQYIDEHSASGGISEITYDETTGDMYAIYGEDSGITNVYMDESGDIYVESEN